MLDAASTIRNRLINRSLELLRIPSITGDEAAIAKHLYKWAKAQKQLSADDITKHGNALVIGHPDTRRPCIALVGHLDTVPPTPADASPKINGNLIIGRGASDMKGAIAIMQVIVETNNLAMLPFALVLVLYDREEGHCRNNGLQPLLENYEPLSAIDLAICMEPTDNYLQLGCMGAISARITFSGRSAHSARPWQGENAIYKSVPILQKLLEQKPHEVKIAGLSFYEVMSITMAKGGSSHNTIPANFELNLNYRFAPTTPIQIANKNAIQKIKNLIANSATIEILDVAPPGPIPNDNLILNQIQQTINLKIGPKQAWTDVARLSAFGIDAVNLGPGAQAQAHQAGESVSIDALVKSYEILMKILHNPLIN
ncbi:MAG: succinyl-diaminopimelate desuccinylase [Deltaproteobacteria bacterium]|nr:succinyl-diaminopimelate desuccinylase [Deltaproteobacteria bacterium]